MTNSTPPNNGPSNANSAVKKSPNDFIFQKLVGEGSFSSVYRALDMKSDRILAIKMCEKKQISKEKKQKAVMREKEIMTILTNNQHPFFVKLFCTFQDEHRLYFAMSYAEKGELLTLLNKVGSFDEECTRFYTAEIVLALEHLHRLNIIHRDLKPENILLSENMHILITDFGSAFLKDKDAKEDREQEPESSTSRRKVSFVGTPQYISPEMLNDVKKVDRGSDLWALGCIIYQLTSGSLLFKGENDYLIFQKIKSLEYKFPDGFNPMIRDLVEKFLRKEPLERLGATDELRDKFTNKNLNYKSIRAHPFFDPYINRWDNLHNEKAPKILPYLPSNSNSEELRSEFVCNGEIRPGLDDAQMTRLLGLHLNEETSAVVIRRSIMDFTEEEKQARLRIQERESKWHRFVEGNLILKEGFINKRKGLFARRRMFLLTTGPHLYYVDESKMVKKGEVPWCKHLRPEVKNFKNFFVHTPKRCFYLEDPNGFAQKWCEAINDVRLFYEKDLIKKAEKEKREKEEAEEEEKEKKKKENRNF